MLSGMNPYALPNRPHPVRRPWAVVGLLVLLAACRESSDASLPDGAVPPTTVASPVPEPPMETTTTTEMPSETSTTTTEVPAVARTTTTAARVAPPSTARVTTSTTEPERPAPAATTTTVPPPPPVQPSVVQQGVLTSHGGPVRDHVSLVDNLRSRGLTVTPLDSVSQPFLHGDGTVLGIGGAGIAPTQLQSFEYESAQAAAADAATFGPEGSPRGVHVDWLAPPHLYLKGRVLVIYVGSDPAVTGLLTDLLGPQFSGR